MPRHNHWWGVLVCVCLGQVGAAQSVIEAGLARLPASVGANRTVTRAPGESWVAIGIREKVGYEHLRRANPGGFTATRTVFIPGRHQVSALMADGLVINLPELMTYRLQKGVPVAWYPNSIGRITQRWRTPVVELHVINREVDPSWHRPDWAGGGVMPPGPRNPLGDRWIGLSPPGYGLHGTNDPTSIGRMVSHGCIRHFPPHIRELFDHVRVDQPVLLTYQTVTLGYDAGTVYLAVFPDIYAYGTNAPRRVHTRLSTLGLGGILTRSELERRLAQPDGIARPLLGSAIRVTVNRAPFATPLGPTVKAGTSFVPLRTLADAVGAQLVWDPATKTATLTRGLRQATFAASDGFLAFNSQFVPVRRLVEALGGTVDFRAGAIAIFV
jgi:L,D-transpeptidase ErfK/SrfK